MATNRGIYVVGGFARQEPHGLDVDTLNGLSPFSIHPDLTRQSPAAAEAARRLADTINKAATTTRWGEGTHRRFTEPRRVSLEQHRAAYEDFRRDWAKRTGTLSTDIVAAFRDYADALHTSLTPSPPRDSAAVALLRDDLAATLADAAEREQSIPEALEAFAARGDHEAAVAASPWGRTAVRRAAKTSPEAVDAALDATLTRLAPERGRGAVAEALNGLDETWRNAGLTRWALDHRNEAVNRAAPEPEPEQ
ncbi:MAG: hypothetical protein ACRDYU_01485 [Actinomycetes bacterium]